MAIRRPPLAAGRGTEPRIGALGRELLTAGLADQCAASAGTTLAGLGEIDRVSAGIAADGMVWNAATAMEEHLTAAVLAGPFAPLVVAQLGICREQSLAPVLGPVLGVEWQAVAEVVVAAGPAVLT